MKRVLTPSLFITYPPSPFLLKKGSFYVLFTLPNIGQNKSRWRLMLHCNIVAYVNKKSVHRVTTGLLQLLYQNPFTGADHEDPFTHLTKFYEIAGTIGAPED